MLQEVLTVAQCVPHLMCRGLTRIRCVHELPAVIRYLSLRHYINGGIIRGQIRDLYPSDTFRVRTTADWLSIMTISVQMSAFQKCFAVVLYQQ